MEFDEMGEKNCRTLGKTGEEKLACYAHLRRQNKQFLQSVNAVRMMCCLSRSPCTWSDTVLAMKRKQTFFARLFLFKYEESNRQAKLRLPVLLVYIKWYTKHLFAL